MGVDIKKKPAAPPLPAPTETDCTSLSTPTEAQTSTATDVSRPGDDHSSYSLPEDGTPVTIKTWGHRAQKSQTSLLIEYFEGGKSEKLGRSEPRKPSVRVRLTPSGKKSKSGMDRDHIQITETKSRKTSLSRRTTQTGPSVAAHHEVDVVSALSGDVGDAKSLTSYASATEESTVSRNPIDIEIDRTGNVRRRRPASPLIPAADSRISHQISSLSDISAIPADSFLDGSGPATSTRMSEAGAKHSRSTSPNRCRVGDVLGGAAVGLAAAAAADRLQSKSRGESRDRERDQQRALVSNSRDKDRKHKYSRSWSSRKEEKHVEDTKSCRKKYGRRSHQELTVSGADSSVVSSGISASHRSVDQHSVRSGTSKASSINNPKLLETVEDAIRRLILPELNALKREHSLRQERRDSTTPSTTGASVSREEHRSESWRSSEKDRGITSLRDRAKFERRDREARHDLDDSSVSHSAVSHDSTENVSRVDDTPLRGSNDVRTTASGAAVAAAAAALSMNESPIRSLSDDKRTRRRRRAELRSRDASEIFLDAGEDDRIMPVAPMPLMSEVNSSEVTRTSILSAETDRPHSATEDQDVSRAQFPVSGDSSPMAANGGPTLRSLGTQHANVSHGDLRALPRKPVLDEDYEQATRGGEPLSYRSQHDGDDYDEDENEDEYEHEQYTAGSYDYYNAQDVPPPLKYVPYQPERRGLSPIPSVSGYTEAGSEPHTRDSRLTQSGSVSSPEKSPWQDRSSHSPNSVHSNIASRRFVDEDASQRSSGLEYRITVHTEDSEPDRERPGQAVRALGANPDFVHALGVDSNVASLVDGSMLEGSGLTAESGRSGTQGYSQRLSMGTLDGKPSQFQATLPSGCLARAAAPGEHYVEERGGTPASASRSGGLAEESELDENGRKVPGSQVQDFLTASEAVIPGAATGVAGAALQTQMNKRKQAAAEATPGVMEEHEGYARAGVQRNQSFKERTMNGTRLGGAEPKHSFDRLSEHESHERGFSGVPVVDEPLLGGDVQDFETTRSPTDRRINWDKAEDMNAGEMTPRPQSPADSLSSRQKTPTASLEGRHGLGLTDVAGFAAAAAAAALAATHESKQSRGHSRQPSQEEAEEDEWCRGSEDRKRDTLVTNPYEGTSPVANLPGLNEAILVGITYESGSDMEEYENRYNAQSPPRMDEGYISMGPNKTPETQQAKDKTVDFDGPRTRGDMDDVSMNSAHDRDLRGLSQGMGPPLYDASTGTGVDRIESKDIVALMQHLMVRDAQRSARDTELLVTLVRSAAEMRDSFEDIKRLLADSEDVIITEVQENTDKTVQRALHGPRPFPGSVGTRLLPGGSQGMTTGDNLRAKKRGFFRKALQGLGGSGTHDLTRIENMLMQLLTEVDVLKSQTAQGGGATSIGSRHDEENDDDDDEPSFVHVQPDVHYEQDRGYEPEGHAGTSTASHGSQSGHLSIPQSRGSGRPGYDAKVSAHSISTVPEANEDAMDEDGSHPQQTRQDDCTMLRMPMQQPRGSSAPLATPPETAQRTQGSASNDNTPRPDEGKKHKPGARTSWFPRISRWSETTTSSVAQAFRRSGQLRKTDDESRMQSNPSSHCRIGSVAGQGTSIESCSDKGHYMSQAKDEVFLHVQLCDPNPGEGGRTATPSMQNMMHGGTQLLPPPHMAHIEATPGASGSTTPEDPKYKAHRNSLNLQHPQPRQGQTERFKAALESQALGYDCPQSPRTDQWGGSATSLTRLAPNENTIDGRCDSYDSTGDVGRCHWGSSTSCLAPASRQRGGNKLQKRSPQPGQQHLPRPSVASSLVPTHGVASASYISTVHTTSRDANSSSPRLENRNLSGALGMPVRRPTGPRAMTPRSAGSAASNDGPGWSEHRRKKDSFGNTDFSRETDDF